jgi:competence ComEA-like helix-hairpin-helix protein
MKKQLKSYTSFSRIERMGLAGLCAILLILLTIRATMPLWMHPATDNEKEKKLIVAWEKFKRANPAINDSAKKEKNDYQDAFDENETPLPNIININTADSATLVRLKGIGPATAGKIMAWRKKKGPFTNINQLLEIRHFPAATFELLKKHLAIDSSLH